MPVKCSINVSCYFHSWEAEIHICMENLPVFKCRPIISTFTNLKWTSMAPGMLTHNLCLFIYFVCFCFFFSFIYLFYFTVLYWSCHTLTWIRHGYTCVPHPEPPLPPPSPSHPPGSSQCTSPKHPVSCFEPGLAIRFTYDNLHVSRPFSHIIPPLPSPTESKRLFYTSVSLAVSHTGLSLASF